MLFEGRRGYLTNDLTSFLEGIKKKRPPDEGWPLYLTDGLTDAYDLPAALRCNSSLFLDAYTGVHLGLYGITSSRDELSVVSFNGLDSIGKHLGNREGVNTSSQHVASERIAEAVG